MWDSKIEIEEINDPAITQRHRAQAEQFARNSKWLEAHWPELLPHAYGRFLAVAGQEAFLADSPEEAWAWAERAHSEDQGPVVQYVMPAKGPRGYAHRWVLADMR